MEGNIFSIKDGRREVARIDCQGNEFFRGTRVSMGTISDALMRYAGPEFQAIAARVEAERRR